MRSEKISIIILSLTILWGCAQPPRFTAKSEEVPVGEIYIENFLNSSGGGPPDLSQRFTEDIKEYYQRNAKTLTLIQNNKSDSYQLQGNIVGYQLQYVAPTNTGDEESAGLSRLKITINTTYINPVNESKGFQNRDFSFYSDFSAERSLTDVEDELIPEIFEQIILDIFAASFDTW